MAEEKSLPTIFSEAIRKERGSIAPRVADHMRPVYGHEPVSKDERRRRFWQTAPGWTVEREYRLLTGMNPDGTPVIDNKTGQPAKPMSPRAVGLVMYPHREIDAKAGGRADDLAAIAAYMREMAELGPPEPEPLESLVMQGETDAGSMGGLGSGTAPALDSAPPVGVPVSGVPAAVPMASADGVVPSPIPDPLMGS